jgi:hypothetical protein
MSTFFSLFFVEPYNEVDEVMAMVTYKSKHDKERFVVQIRFGEQRQPKVDKDKVLRQLRKNLEQGFCRPLGPTRHALVCIVLQRNAAEQQ